MMWWWLGGWFGLATVVVLGLGQLIRRRPPR